MGLVAVRDSIVRGYAFLFARFFTVLGLGWLSAAFYGFACSWLIRAVSTGALGAPPASGAFNQYSLGYLVATVIVTAFFSAPMLIPFTREALGMHEEPVAAHFSYGPREWRLFVALLRFFGILGAALFILIVGSGIAISQFANSPIVWLGVPLVAWLNSLSAVIVLSTAAFLAVRLGFFLGTIAAVEGHASLTRAWALSRANFWRLALVFLAVAIPALLVVLICEYALWGSELDAATRSTGSSALAIFKLQFDHSVSIAAMMATALTAVNALLAAASAAAYRAQSEDAGETTASAPESNWGIHRAPAMADSGPMTMQRFEPAAFVETPAVEDAPASDALQDGPQDVPQEVTEIAAETPVEEAAAEEAFAAEIAPAEAVPAIVDEGAPDDPAADAATVEAEALPVVEKAALVPAEPLPVEKPEVLAAEPALEIPAELPIDNPPAVEVEPVAATAPVTEAAPAMPAPPLDPAGLAQAMREHEPA